MKIVSVQALEQIAKKIRKGIIEQVYSAQSGHPGGALSCADILTVLYFNQMNINPKEPLAEGRDRLVLSKGHCSPALYAALAQKGYFEESRLKEFRKIDGLLQGHPDMKNIPGVDMSSGSLGQGLSIANGMALNSKMDKLGYRVYCIVGDGEIEEGQIWEAAMTASKYNLDNLCIVVDNNNLQIDGTIEDVKGVKDIEGKFEKFGFNVITTNGNKISDLIKAFDKAKSTKGKPTAIVAITTKGKGVSFMENKAEWHGKAPNEEQYKLAIEELNAD